MAVSGNDAEMGGFHTIEVLAASLFKDILLVAAVRNVRAVVAYLPKGVDVERPHLVEGLCVKGLVRGVVDGSLRSCV